MQRIGRVLHISRNKNIILKAEKLPKIGDSVIDEALKPVGTVFDVFGPVSSPYIAVKPGNNKTHRNINKFLYIDSSSKNKKKKKG